jgi:hypothetical protein
MLTFHKLWNNHPTITGNDIPCKTNGKANFPNQCAIRMGGALSKYGVKTFNRPGATHCWHGHPKSEGHIIRAEELANGLNKDPIAGIQKIIKVTPDDFAKELSGRAGIIFFKDYWQRTENRKKEAFRNRSGDHIDLWNGNRITDWKSWARIHIRIGSLGLHTFVPGFSDLEDSRSVWFWRVL